MPGAEAFQQLRLAAFRRVRLVLRGVFRGVPIETAPSEADEAEDSSPPPRLESVAASPIPKVGQAAPRGEPGVTRLFVAELLLTDHRVQAVCPDQKVPTLLVAAGEKRRHA